MQQKSFRYLLLAVVAIIWGSIIYKTLSSLNKEEDFLAPVTGRSFKFEENNPDSGYTLLQNYTDPFGADDNNNDQQINTDSLIRVTDKYLQKTSQLQSAKSPGQEVNFIKYKGIISNPATKKTVALISINGKDEFAPLNKKISGFKINLIRENKLQVIYLNKKFWIKKE